MTVIDIPDLSLDDLRAFARSEVEAARAAGNMPRVHPNGFIQLDLQPSAGWDKHSGHSGANRRLHIWNPPDLELPRQGTVNEIHDHVFDMRSTVVRGGFEQCLYELIVGGSNAEQARLHGERVKAHLQSHELYRAVYDQTSSSRLEATGVRGWLRHVAMQPVAEGMTYTQPAFTLHDTNVEPDYTVITIMEKMAIHDGEASVVCPIGVEPDNDFDRLTAAPQEDLWAAIDLSLV